MLISLLTLALRRQPVKGCTITELSVPSRDEADKLQRLSREPSENLEYLAMPNRSPPAPSPSRRNSRPKRSPATPFG